MELSIFLAKLLGLYLLIIAGLWVIQKDQVDHALRDLLSSRGLLLFSGAVNIVAGLAIVIGHPVWEMNWQGLISLLGYVILLQGILRFGFADKVQRNAQMIAQKGFRSAIVVLVVLGAYLTYCGFANA